jgi:hypothetical protein
MEASVEASERLETPRKVPNANLAENQGKKRHANAFPTPLPPPGMAMSPGPEFREYARSQSPELDTEESLAKKRAYRAVTYSGSSGSHASVE